MSPATPEPAALSTPSRLLHLLLAAGFAVATLMLVEPELAQFVASQRAPYHFGDPPRVLPILAGLLPIPGVLTLLVRFLRRRPAPLWASGLVVAGAFLAMGSMGLSDVPTGRTWAAADAPILKTARELQQRMVERLKVEGTLPNDEAAWTKALAEMAPQPSPARTRAFEPVPYRLVLVREQGKVPAGLVPGALVVWVNPARDYFELTPVGFAQDGSVGPLPDPKGEKVMLRAGLAPRQAGAP